ncbi:MAG TPA: hypothetical protein VE200_13880 [Xanthobacteraceae bacterium]|nr:hypothetical protein [Xanthobacteraceae bacterium]
MPAHLTIQGIQELKIALGNLPTDLKGQATQLVLDSAYAAQAEIVAAYPQGPTGKLKKGVKVRVQEIGPYSVAAQVRSSAPHGWLYEHGTQPRKTKRGWNRGTMPNPADVFIPAMVRYRRAMYLKLADLIRATGLIVTLDA